MASISILMPSLSPTMEEGVIVQWHVRPGDRIEQGALLCSIETDKTTVDYESFEEGFVRHLAVQPGTKVKVNELIALLTETADEEFSLPQSPLNPQKSQAQASSLPVNAPGGESSAHSAPDQSRNPERLRASPLAKRIAKERGIDLSLITGSGPGGRIIRADVESYVPAPLSSKSSPASIFHEKASCSRDQDIPLTQMRRVIGERLLSSWNGAPAFFISMRYDVGKLIEIKEQLNRETGHKISLNDLMVKAVALALRAEPKINASFMGDRIRYHADVDICVAVAIEDGLITPIVRQADRLTLGVLSGQIRELAEKARSGTLRPEEYQGGSFTISNLGMFGVHHFTSILNPPQAAILAIAAVQSELYRDANGSIGERKVMECTLTADHRVIDGALAARFLNTLKKYIENPLSLML